jgi:3-hydroxybutyryl-CoA dehydrogenase
MLTVAVIGAGVAGRGFAAVCAAAGFAVTLEDVMPSKLRQADEELAEFKGLVRLVMTVEDAVRDADVVVDFVPDELESKLEIWSMIDRMAPPKTVMCTPSDALSITDLASCTYRGDRCVMVRGLGSASVRLLRAAETSDGTIQVVAALFSGLGVEWSAEADPDLPMLLKNMRAARIS